MGCCGKQSTKYDLKQKIGSKVTCPYCQKQFSPNQTQLELNDHVNQCMSLNESNVDKYAHLKDWQKKLIVKPPQEIKTMTFPDKYQWFKLKSDEVKVPFSESWESILCHRDTI